MLNRYPRWKYLVLIGLFALGLIYALPNIYGEDSAIQISGSRGVVLNQVTLDLVRSALDKNGVNNYKITFEDSTILIRVANNDEQLKVKEILTKMLSRDYVVALNLVSATPKWLKLIGAEPVKLGLDLRGGIHLLMEVDMAGILDRLQEQVSDSLKFDLKAKNINFFSIVKLPNHHLVIRLREKAEQEAVASLLRRLDYLTILSQKERIFTVAINENRLQQTKMDVISQNITVLRNRLNQLGVSESIVQRQGADRIVVELPGIQDSTLAKQILGATVTLEFRQVNESLSNDFPAILSGQIEPPYGSEIKYQRNGIPILVYKQVILTGEHIVGSTFRMNEYGQPIVDIRLDSVGGRIMFNFTQNNKQKMMSTLFIEYVDSGERDNSGKIIVNKRDEIINVARINDVFSDRFQISGISSIAEAKELSLLLRSGALIAPVQIVEERIVGPTMGQENIIKGLKSCFWGLVVSIIFMLAIYRLFGLFASIALIINLILIVAIMSLLPGITLSMPGIAGIVLTVGMAVDANVLINERIKEELSKGREIQSAINEGYAGAWNSIFDANITTLIMAMILYFVGSGSVKGFAITLAIGVMTSMFTSIVGTRSLVNLIYGRRKVSKLSI